MSRIVIASSSDGLMSYRRTFFVSILASALLLLGSCEFLQSFGDEFEPNDSIAEAYPIELGESYTAHISEEDADFFSFETEHGSRTFDELEISVTDVGPELRIGIAVYNPAGELIHTKTTNTKGADLSTTLRDLQSDDTYYVRFSGTWGTSAWEVDSYGDYDTVGAYTFVVRNKDANDEFAGNHSIDDAYEIEVGQTYNGVLVSNYEKDFYSFTPTAEDMRVVVSETGSELKLGFVLYAPNREKLGKHTTNTAGAVYHVDLNNMDTEATYFIRFNGTWGTSGWQVGSYGDNDSRGPYTFTVNELH